MDGAGLLNRLKISTSTQNSDIADTTYELALSESHSKIVEKIKTKIDSKIFYSEFTTDLEVGRTEYDELPITSASAVWVKYNKFESDGVTAGKYVKATIEDITESDRSLADLEVNQSQSSPIFMIADDSIFLYPVADSDVTDGIQARGKLKVPRITITSLESAIFEGKLSEYHEVIVQGAKGMIYEVNKDTVSARESRAEYRLQLEEMITEISGRYDQPIDIVEPSRAEFTTNYGGEDTFLRNN